MIDLLKRSSVIRFFYHLPGVSDLYYFLLAFFGAVWYGFPSRHLTVIGITGTKGKTSVTQLLGFLLEQPDVPVAILSSVGATIKGVTQPIPYGNTMPGRFFIQRFLRQAVASGCRYAVIEVTSQGTVMHRHRFIAWSAGLLTNLSPEHIEWHGSFENYRNAKGMFLRAVCRRGGSIFLNVRDEHTEFYRRLVGDFGCKPLLFSVDQLKLESVSTNPYFNSEFNRENAAAAAAVASFFRLDPENIAIRLKSFLGVSGRFDFIQRTPFSVVVDYAHTPDSLRAVYSALRLSLAPTKKLICVLGSAGGGRDRWKRPEMGKVASWYCDQVILTNEDPYDEDPSMIIEDIRAGVDSEKLENTKIVVDRRSAIAAALASASSGDVVVLTGKGSENWIHEGDGKKIHWNERAIAQELLQDKKSREK